MDTAELGAVAATITDFFVNYSFQILGAVIILAVGFILAGWTGKTVIRLCESRNVDPMLSRFFGGAAKILILIFAVIIAMGKFGVSLAPFVAALGALTLGASFAVQGVLSNYGAGLTIILTRPFTIGHTITVAGVRGVVEDISLSACILSTEDGERIMIPNKHIVGEILVNSYDHSVVEFVVGVSYGDDPEKAMEAIAAALSRFPEVAQDPPSQIGIEEFADSSINIGVRYWVPTRQFHQTQYKVNLSIHKALAEAGVTIPFPQADVRITRENA